MKSLGWALAAMLVLGACATCESERGEDDTAASPRADRVFDSLEPRSPSDLRRVSLTYEIDEAQNPGDNEAFARTADSRLARYGAGAAKTAIEGGSLVVEIPALSLERVPEVDALLRARGRVLELRAVAGDPESVPRAAAVLRDGDLAQTLGISEEAESVQASFALGARSIEPDSQRARGLPAAMVEEACRGEAPCRIGGRWFLERYLEERGDAIASALGHESLAWGFEAADPRGDRVIAYPLATEREVFTEFEDAIVEGDRNRPHVVLTLSAEAGERLATFSRQHLGRLVAFSLDKQLLTVPRIAGAIEGGEVSILVPDFVEAEHRWALAVAWATALPGEPLSARLVLDSEEEGTTAACGDEASCAEACAEGVASGCLDQATARGETGGSASEALGRACELGVVAACERACDIGGGERCLRMADIVAKGPLIARDRSASYALLERACALGEAAGCERFVNASLDPFEEPSLVGFGEEPVVFSELRSLVSRACEGKTDARCGAAAALVERSRAACDSPREPGGEPIMAEGPGPGGERIEFDTGLTSGGRRLEVGVQACENLAHLYAEGLGVDRDPDRASEIRARAKKLREGLPQGDGVTDPLVASGRGRTLAQKGAPADSEDESALPWREDEGEAFAEAEAQGKGVVIWFSAEWATSSQNLAEVLAQPEIREAIAEAYIPLRFDVTASTTEDRARQNAYDSHTVPTLIVLDAGGQELRRLTSPDLRSRSKIREAIKAP